MTRAEWCAENPNLCDEEGNYLYDDNPWEDCSAPSQDEIEEASRSLEEGFASQRAWDKAYKAAVAAGKSKKEAEDAAYAAYLEVDKKHSPWMYEKPEPSEAGSASYAPF